jgi:hypothetical protein
VPACLPESCFMQTILFQACKSQSLCKQPRKHGDNPTLAPRTLKMHHRISLWASPVMSICLVPAMQPSNPSVSRGLKAEPVARKPGSQGIMITLLALTSQRRASVQTVHTYTLHVGGASPGGTYTSPANSGCQWCSTASNLIVLKSSHVSQTPAASLQCSLNCSEVQYLCYTLAS